MYKKYMLKCSEFTSYVTTSDDPSGWNEKDYYFDTEEEMIDFVKSHLDFAFRVEAAFKLEQLSNDIFC